MILAVEREIKPQTNQTNKQMDQNIGKWKMLALWTMAGDMVKKDANKTIIFKTISMTFSICVHCLYDQNQHCIEH